MILAAEQVAQILYQAGFRGEDLIKMVAIAKRESGYETNAHRTDQDRAKITGDRGLFQINFVNDNALIRAGVIKSKADLFDPVKNAMAAFWLYKQSGLQPWTAGPGGWTAGGDPLHGTNVEQARLAVQKAQEYGILGKGWQGTVTLPQYAGGSVVTYAGPGVGPAGTNSIQGVAGPAGTPLPGSGTYSGSVSLSPSATAGPVTLPPDTTLYTVTGGGVWAVYDVGGVRLAYDVLTSGVESNWQAFTNHTVSGEQWAAMNVVNAGKIGELEGVGENFGTYGDFFRSIMDQVVGPYNPAGQDPEVLRVIAEFAARPDMTSAELESKLQRTTYWNTRTQAQLEWNGLSQGEKDYRVSEVGRQAADVWFRTVGVRLDPGDQQLAAYVAKIASGEMGWGAFQNIANDYAASNPESPYSRDTRSEVEAQRQRPIDIENTAANIRQLLNNWGLSWTEQYILQWAKEVVEKTKSDDDLVQAMKGQAASLYPWKDPELETIQAAQPWLQTYEAVMEGPATLRTDEIRRALTSGQTVFDFEQSLKTSPNWATTKNGQSQISSMVADLGRKMGYQ